MLLLSKDINSALQNHSYPRKCQPLNKERTGYIDGSFSEREVAKTYKDWNPDSIYKRTMVLIKFFKTRWGVSFNTAQKEVLSGMSFMSKERVLSNELFNHNTFTGTLKSTFEANGYLVNIESRYIQFMKPDWVFNDNTHTSIHFELKISSNNRFDNLLGNQVPIFFAFHTETDCPDDLRRMFKPTRIEIGEPLIVDDFKTIDAYNASLEKVIIFIEDMFKTYGDNISNVIENHNQ